jgi:hypothetical protein
MKKSTTEQLQSGLGKCQGIKAAIAKDEKLLADSTTELAALEVSADLSNGSTLGQLSKLQTIVMVAPKRLAARREEFSAAKKTLLAECGSFIATAFGPRYKDLEGRAVAKVEANLKPFFGEEHGLRQAAYGTKELSALEPLKAQTFLRDADPEDAMRLAQELLDAWHAAEAFGKEYLS